MSLYRRYRPLLNLLGLLLLAAVILVFKIDLRQTANYLLHADGLALAGAVLLFVPFLVAKAWRWHVILQDLQIRISFADALKLYALGLGAGMATPGQLGDAVKVAYLSRRSLGRSLVSVLLDRLWDVLVLLLLAGAGAVLFWREFESEWAALGLLLAAVVAVLALTTNARAQTRLLSLLGRLRGGADRASYEPVHLSAAQILRQLGLTVLATSIVYSRYYLLTTALGIRLDVLPFIATMSLATVAALLPVSVSGVGTRDATLILLAPLVGLSQEQALGLSTLILFLNVVNGLVGFAVWMNWKLDLGTGSPELNPTPLNHQ